MYAHAQNVGISGQVTGDRGVSAGERRGTPRVVSKLSSLPPAASCVGRRRGGRAREEEEEEENNHHRRKEDRNTRKRMSMEGKARKIDDINAQLFQHKMRLVEKILDVHIHSMISTSFAQLRLKEREAVFSRPLQLPALTEKEDPAKASRRYVVGRASLRPSISSSPLPPPSLASVSSTEAEGGIGTNSQRGPYEMERMLRKRLWDEYRADAALVFERCSASPQDEYHLFVALRRLASMSRNEAKMDVRDAVAQYIDPHVKAFWEQKRGQCVTAGYNGRLKSVEQAIRRAVAQKKEELEKSRVARAELRHADRLHRVQLALSILKKDVGDISHLRYVVPERFEAPAGHTAMEEVRRLRVRVHQQHLEEQEWQWRLEKARTEHKKRLQVVQEEVELLRDKKRRALQSILTKEAYIDEIKAVAGAGGRGPLYWAEKTLQLEVELSDALREGSHLQAACDELRRQLQLRTAEKNTLDVELANEEAKLTSSLAEKEEITTLLMEGLDKARATVLQLRCKQNLVVRELNAMRDTMVSGYTLRLSTREALKKRMMTAVSQLALEELLYSRLTSQLHWKQEQLEKEEKVELSLVAQQESNKQEQHMSSFERVVDLAKEVARFVHVGGDNRNMALQDGRSEAELQDRVAECYDTCLRLRADIAKLSDSDETALLITQRRQEQLDRQLLEWKLRQEPLFSAGVSSFGAALSVAVAGGGVPSLTGAGSAGGHLIPLPTAATIYHDAQPLYAAVSHLLHRENRCKMLLQLLQKSGEGELRRDGMRHFPFRSACSSAAAPEVVPKAARDPALQTPSHSHSAFTSTSASLGASMTQPSLPLSATYRKMVLQFIKNEIQPLYDANRISRVRFMDVVERVLRGFLSSHPVPQPVLSETDRQALCQQIQMTLTWQDGQGVARHGV